jgi:hypothetical protein
MGALGLLTVRVRLLVYGFTSNRSGRIQWPPGVVTCRGGLLAIYRPSLGRIVEIDRWQLARLEVYTKTPCEMVSFCGSLDEAEGKEYGGAGE